MPESQNGNGSEYIGSNLPAQPGSSYSTRHRVASKWVLNISSEGDSMVSVGNLFQCLLTHTVNKLFLVFTWRELPVHQFLLWPLVLMLGTTEQSLAPSSRHPPSQYVCTLMGSSLSHLLWRLNRPHERDAPTPSSHL